MRARMGRWQERWPQIADVRGLGAMLAIELVHDATKARAELASRVVDEALARGLLLLKAGVAGNCIRVLVPLVISDAELDEALHVWEDALEPRALASPARGTLTSRWSGKSSQTATSSRSSSAPGGMSSVFRAHDRLLDRKVALKILHQQYTGDAEYVERFRREARAVARSRIRTSSR